MKKEYKHIFEPFTVRRMTMKNRIMMTPMGTNYGEQNGEVLFKRKQYGCNTRDTGAFRDEPFPYQLLH